MMFGQLSDLASTVSVTIITERRGDIRETTGLPAAP
jgi:hypothetical protein